MGTTVTLNVATLEVEPGQSVSTELRVRNTGTVVDQFSFQPLGVPAGWIQVEPPIVRLFPDTDETVTITIAPPRDPSATPGEHAWGVKATPQEDPAGSATAEGTVDVATFHEYTAELQPVTGRARLTGRFDVAIDNRGNLPLPFRLAGSDKEQALAFEFDPTLVETEPGAAHFTKVRVRPAQRIWRGQPKTHPFQVLVEPQVATTTESADGTTGGAPSGGVAVAAPTITSTVLAGNLLQEPVVPKWLWKALLALLALVIALWILWKTLLQPEVESAARAVAVEEVEQVEAQVEAVEEQVDELEPAVEQAAAQAAEAEESAAAAEEAASGGGGGGEGGGGGLGGVLNETSVPEFFALAASGAAAGAGGDTTGPMADGTTFAVTDIVLQNPTGSTGLVEVSVDGVPVLHSSLETFRDLDFHYVSPFVVESGQTLDVGVECPAEACSVFVTVSGFRTQLVEDA